MSTSSEECCGDILPADYKTLLGLVREFVARYDAYGKSTAAGESQWPQDLQEQLIRARAAIAPSEPRPQSDPAILHMGFSDDPCCSIHAMRDARAGKLDVAFTWDCPRCKTAWKVADREASVRHWQAEVGFTTFTPRA